MALKIRTIGNPDLIGDIQPGWSIDENATPHAIGDGSASVGGVQFSAGRRDDSEFLLNKPVTVYYEPEGTVATGNNVTGVFDSVDTSGGSVGVTTTNKLGTLTAERRAEPIFPNKLYNSFTDPTIAGAVILSLGGIDVDPSGNLYAVDRGYAINRVARYDPNGLYLGDFNLVEPGSGITNSPSGRVYVQPGTSGNYGSVYGPEGGFLYFLNDNLGGDTSTNGPAAIDPAGNVYVFAGGQDRVKKFNSSGTFIATYGNGRGTGDGFFGGTVGSGSFFGAPIVADSSNFYVLDSLNNRVQVFTSGGAFISKFTVPAGSIRMKATTSGNLVISNNSGLSEYTKAGAIVRTTASIFTPWTIFNNNIYYGETPPFVPTLQSRWQVRRASYPGRIVETSYTPGNGPLVPGDTANSLPFIFNAVTGTYMVPSETTSLTNEYDLSGNRISTFDFQTGSARLQIQSLDYASDGTLYGFANGTGGVWSVRPGQTAVRLGSFPGGSTPFAVHKPTGDFYFKADTVAGLPAQGASLYLRDKFGNDISSRTLPSSLNASSMRSLWVLDDRTVFFWIISSNSGVAGIYRWNNGDSAPSRVIAPGSLSFGAVEVDPSGSIFVADGYLNVVPFVTYMREYTLSGTFIRTDLMPGVNPIDGVYFQVVAPRTLAVRSGKPKSISLSPTGTPALSSALTIYLSYTGRAPIFSGANPPAVYPGWTDSVWTKLNELCAATVKEIVLQNESIIVRDVASTTISLDNFVGSPQRSVEKGSGRHIEIVNQNTSVVSNSPVFDYTVDAGRAISADLNEYNVTNVRLNTWLTSIQSPTPVDAVIGVYTPPGTYMVFSQENFPVPANTWKQYGGSFTATVGADGQSIDFAMQGPSVPIGGYTAPFSISAVLGGSKVTGVSVLGSGVMTNPIPVTVATGADWSIVTQDIAQTINQPFITSLGVLFDRAEFACAASNGGGQVLDITVPTSDIGGLGLTAGSMFQYNKAVWRVRSSKIGNATVSIKADSLTSVGQHDSVVPGETIGQHDARLAALTLGDSALKPLY